MSKIKQTILLIGLVAMSVAMLPVVFGADDAPNKKIKVFLLAGQSNMDGRGDGSKLTAEDNALLAQAQKHIQFAYNHEPIVPLNVTPAAGPIAKKFNLRACSEL